MSWTESERMRILSRSRQVAESLTGQKMMSLTQEEFETLEAEEISLLQEYAENIPYSFLSRCPFCESEFGLAIDLVGLDGPWWWATCPVQLPPHSACEHFQFFQGALNLHDRVPQEVFEGVMIGPAAPFVIQRLLEMESVQAVVSQFTMKTGDTAHLIVYFSDNPINPAELHQDWRKEWYAVLDDDGEIMGTESKFDPWDFDLAPWLELKKLLWIKPGDQSLKLRTALSAPFVDLEGTHAKQIIQEGVVELWAAPEGQESGKFESA